jgi:hypothetical protein
VNGDLPPTLSVCFFGTGRPSVSSASNSSRASGVMLLTLCDDPPARSSAPASRGRSRRSTIAAAEFAGLAGASNAACGAAVRGRSGAGAISVASFIEGRAFSIAIGVYWIEVAPPCAGATVMKTLSPCAAFLKFMMARVSCRALDPDRATYGCQPSAASNARVASVACATDSLTTKDVVDLFANSSCAPTMRGRRLASSMSANPFGTSGFAAM